MFWMIYMIKFTHIYVWYISLNLSPRSCKYFTSVFQQQKQLETWCECDVTPGDKQSLDGNTDSTDTESITKSVADMTVNEEEQAESEDQAKEVKTRNGVQNIIVHFIFFTVNNFV